MGLVYLQDAPLWRTAWRAVDTEDGIRLIGWAVVENTTGIDWDDIQLTLATGSVRAIEARLYARTYAHREQAGDIPPPAARWSPPRRNSGAPSPRWRKQAGRPRWPTWPKARCPVSVSADDGDSFSRFTLDTPVTLAAGQMMSVPFLSEDLPDARLVLYRGGQGDRHPVIALSLENPLPLRLPAGVLTLYEDGRGHAGDAMIPELAPGATEIVDFARDTAVEVREETTSTEAVREMRIAGGMLHVSEDLERRVTYRIEGAADDAREVTIDHPRRAGWRVSSATGPEERPDAWRWVVRGPGRRARAACRDRASAAHPPGRRAGHGRGHARLLGRPRGQRRGARNAGPDRRIAARGAR